MGGHQRREKSKESVGERKRLRGWGLLQEGEASKEKRQWLKEERAMPGELGAGGMESEQEAGASRNPERLKKWSLEHWRQRDKGLDKDIRDLET